MLNKFKNPQDQSPIYSAGRISKNFLFMLVARFIDTLAQLAIISTVARYLGAERYGDYGYIMALVAVSISFTYMGIERITIREISRNKSKAGQYLGAAIMTRWLYMAIVLPIITAIIFFMDLSPDVILAVYITTFALHFMSESYVHVAMFKSFEKMGYETLLTLIFQTLNMGFVFLIAHLDLGFIYLFVALLIANLVRNIMALTIACKRFAKPDLRINVTGIKFFVKESFALGLLALISHCFISVDILILKALKSASEVSMFYAPHNLIILMNVVPNSLLSTLFPAFCRAARGDLNSLVYGYEKSFKILTITSFFLIALFVAFSDKIVLILFGNKFLAAVDSLRILSLSFIFIFLFNVFDYTLIAVNRQNTLILCPLVGLAVKVILNLALIPQYGYMGASVAAVGGYLFFFAMGFFLSSRYIVTLPLHRIVLKPGLIALLIALCLYRFNYGNMFLLSLGGLAAYGLCLFWFKIFSPDEISFFKDILRKACIISLGRKYRLKAE